MAPKHTWVGVFFLAGVATAISVALLDGPAATFVHGLDRPLQPFIALTHLVDPVLPVAIIGFLGLGSAVALGWNPPPWARLALAVCVASLLAVMVKDQLKYAFGRTWPETWVNNNPSWIRDHVMGFTPFHGGPGWASFPSGHTTLATAPMTVLMITLRSAWRWLCAVPIALVAIGLYGADYHFIGDMIAGVMVGALCAAIAFSLLRAPGDAR